MPFASYFENISERLLETQNNFREEISSLRVRISNTSAINQQSAVVDVSTLKRRLTKYLDELEQRSEKIFSESLARLRDRHVNLAAYMKKRDSQLSAARGQLSDAEKNRDRALTKRDKTREVNTSLVGERDKLLKDNRELRRENEHLKNLLKNNSDWQEATKGVAKGTRRRGI